mgnify:CR=1 FL=1
MTQFEQAMDKIAKAIKVPYVSVSIQDGTTGKTTSIKDKEYEY